MDEVSEEHMRWLTDWMYTALLRGFVRCEHGRTTAVDLLLLVAAIFEFRDKTGLIISLVPPSDESTATMSPAITALKRRCNPV